MGYYNLRETGYIPDVVRFYTLRAMKECGISDFETRIYSCIKTNHKGFFDASNSFIERCNCIHEQKQADIYRTQKYRQTAVSKQAEVLYNLRTLADWCVEEEAYKAIKKAIKLIDNIDSTAFAEDNDGNRLKELIPACKPDWKK